MNPIRKTNDIMTSEAAYGGQRILRYCVEKAIRQYMKYTNVEVELDNAVTIQDDKMRYIYNDKGTPVVCIAEDPEDEPTIALNSDYFVLPDLIYILEKLETEFAPMYELADAFEHGKFTPRNGTMGKWRNKYKLEMTKLIWERNQQDGWQINMYDLTGKHLGTLISNDSGKLIFDI